MPSDLLELVLPDWGSLDSVRRSPLPFGLWTIGDQCLLHHWFDHAVNQGASRVHVFAADRPAAVRQVLAESLLWPLTLEFTAIATQADAPAGAILVDWLPGAAPAPDTVDLALSERTTGVSPVMEDSASRLSAHETTGWKPVVHDRQDAYPPAILSVLAAPPPPAHGWDLIARAAAMERAWLERMAGESDYALLSIGFACKIHPQTQLIPPYFIGDEVFIGPGCEIGPYAVIGPGSVLAGANRVVDSQLAARSFLGPVLALDQCLLDSGVLFNLKHQTRLDQFEPHLLGSAEKATPPVPLRERLQALILYLRLDAPPASGATFTTFDGRQLPGDSSAGLGNRKAWLPLVWQGKLPLYGILPRTAAQFESLNPDWKNLISNAPIGVFSYADSQGCHSPEHPEEALHAVYQASLPPATLSSAIAEFIRRLRSLT